MRKKLSLALIVGGIVLVLAAVGLCVFNVMTDRKSGRISGEILAELKENITPAQENTQNRIEEILNNDIFDEAEQNDYGGSQVQIGENSYIGYITIPDIGVELPVMSDWSYSQLEYAPCRYSGSAADSNLIIAAHNYGSHFRGISSLNAGNLLYFTDTDGIVYEYRVVATEVIGGLDADAMLSDRDGSWDLTLFTCTLDGRNRVTVRAVKTNR